MGALHSGIQDEWSQEGPKGSLDTKEIASSLFSMETPVLLRDTTEPEIGIPLIINNLRLFSG
jgi:hypothetical protein